MAPDRGTEAIAQDGGGWGGFITPDPQLWGPCSGSHAGSGGKRGIPARDAAETSPVVPRAGGWRVFPYTAWGLLFPRLLQEVWLLFH